MADNLPIVLTIGGYDPSGGAGITSDIETISSLDCHAISLISCLTSQNTQEFNLLVQVDPELFADQANLLLSDFKIDVLKIGVLKGTRIIEEEIERFEKLKLSIAQILSNKE